MSQSGGHYDRKTLQTAAAATGDGEEFDVANSPTMGTRSIVTFQVTGTFSATATFEATLDGTNWVSFRCANIATGAVATTATAAGIYRGAVVGVRKVRARVSTYASGTITVAAQVTVGSALDETGTAITALAPGTGASDLGKAEDAVHASGDVGVMALAVRQNTATALAANGDYIPLIVDAEGKLWVEFDTPSSEFHIGQVTPSRISVSIAPVLDTSAYTSGDVLFATTEVPAALRGTAGWATLESVAVIEKDDETAFQMDLYFFSGNVTFGTINTAPSISDGEAASSFLCRVTILSTDFVDLGGVKVASIGNIGKTVTGSTTSTWVAATVTGTPTFTAATDMQIVLNFVDRS